MKSNPKTLAPELLRKIDAYWRASAIRLARRIGIAPVPSPAGRKAGGTHLSLSMLSYSGAHWAPGIRKQ